MPLGLVEVSAVDIGGEEVGVGGIMDGDRPVCGWNGEMIVKWILTDKGVEEEQSQIDG